MDHGQMNTIRNKSMAILVFLLVTLPAGSSSAADVDESVFIRMRERMVKYQIARREIADRDVLRAMSTIPRHRFVPKGLADKAYDDTPLPIGYGQTISQPYIVAFMTEIVRADNKSTVLEVGTGSGYQAAVLSAVAGRVYTIEIIPQLAE
jgi:protein-L-isoaspartate(D-aspartate) O-methyltransferase